MTAFLAILATVTLVLTGLSAGVFFAYSVSVMWGLDGIGPRAAIAAMQSINRRIQNLVFFAAFLGAPLAALVSGVAAGLRGHGSAAVLFLAACAAYLAGVFAVTVAVNVPLNDRLDALGPPDDPAADRGSGGPAGEPAAEHSGATWAALTWSAYSTRWSRWNHVRSAFSLLALVLAGAGSFVLAWSESAA